MADMNEPGWVLAQLSKEYTNQALRIADQLRETADRIERQATAIPINRSAGVPDHNRSVSGILSEINAFHGNLSTSNLLMAAADADREARNPRGST